MDPRLPEDEDVASASVGHCVACNDCWNTVNSCRLGMSDNQFAPTTVELTATA